MVHIFGGWKNEVCPGEKRYKKERIKGNFLIGNFSCVLDMLSKFSATITAIFDKLN